MYRLEVSAAVRHIYIYIYVVRLLKVNILKMWPDVMCFLSWTAWSLDIKAQGLFETSDPTTQPHITSSFTWKVRKQKKSVILAWPVQCVNLISPGYEAWPVQCVNLISPGYEARELQWHPTVLSSAN